MFSVVIPLYNKAHTILRTLASVLNQTFVDFEVIIINDGSTDNALNLINKFTADNRVNIYNQENQGVSVARNNGVKLSKFPYVAFLDGDDEWLPDFLLKFNEAIRLFPEAGFFGSSSWHRDFKTGEEKDSTPEKYRNKIQGVDYFFNPQVMPHTSAVVIRKDFFNSIDSGNGFPEGMKVCEDWSLFFRLASIATSIYIGFPLGIRNYNVKGQITGLNFKERFLLLVHVVNFYNIVYEFWNKMEVLDERKIEFIKYDLRHRFIMYLRSSDYRSIQCIINGLDPSIKTKFWFFEFGLYNSQKLNAIARFYILLTKVLYKTLKFF